jgi:3-deoxy-D-manno-octulosonic-acid transferase
LQAGEVLDGDILIVDNVGMLSRIYQYSSLTIIGGGFGKGIHNTLEAAVYGQPLVFGPNYQKFDEAIGLVRVGAAFSAQSFEEFKLIVQKLLNGEEVRQEASKAAKHFVRSGQGAKNHILNFLKTRLKHRT